MKARKFSIFLFMVLAAGFFTLPFTSLSDWLGDFIYKVLSYSGVEVFMSPPAGGFSFFDMVFIIIGILILVIGFLALYRKKPGEK